MKLKLFLAIAVLALCTGCKDPYGATAKASSAIGESISQGMNTTSQLVSQGTITSTEALNVLGYLEYANKANEAFDTCISAAHTGGNKPGTYTACAEAFNQNLNNPAQLALIKVGNTTASQTITTVVDAISAGVSTIESALGGA